MTDCKHLELKLMLALTLTLFGCMAHKTRTSLPAGTTWHHAPPMPSEPVPGHPGLHLGPPRVECLQVWMNEKCVTVRNWLDENNQPVLTPFGCFLAKARVTWLLGDRVSMCEKKVKDGVIGDPNLPPMLKGPPPAPLHRIGEEERDEQ
jgi:hypothetical protein